MNRPAAQSLAIACLFLWIGFVCAISFLESWLKFRAPGVSLAIGLGIGRLVFAALNKIEWVFALIVCISVLLRSRSLRTRSTISVAFVVLILILQSIWLLPALDLRAGQYIQHQSVAPSYLHQYFVFAELLKVAGLFISGISLLKQP